MKLFAYALKLQTPIIKVQCMILSRNFEVYVCILMIKLNYKKLPIFIYANQNFNYQKRQLEEANLEKEWNTINRRVDRQLYYKDRELLEQQR